MNDFIQTVDGKRLFKYLGLNKSVRIAGSVSVIGRECFAYWNWLSSISFARGRQLRQFDERAFCGCSLASITIPQSVVVLGAACFSACRSLNSVSFAKKSELERIESDAFLASGLESIVIPRSVRVIGSSCFNGCNRLASVAFEPGSQVRRIEAKVFSFCPRLTKVVIPRNVEQIGAECFVSSTLLSSILFEDECDLREIENSLFWGTGLKSITIPRNVLVIQDFGFCSLGGISISVDAANRSFSVREDCVTSFDGRKLFRYFGSDSQVVVDGNVEVLGSGCFSSLARLSSVSFASDPQLKQIEGRAFSHSGLKSIVVPRTVREVGAGCFLYCRCLLSVEFEHESALKEFGSSLFAFSRLESMTIPRSVSWIAGSAFGGLRGIQISIESGNESFIADEQFVLSRDRSKLIRYIGSSLSVVVRGNVENIGSECFSHCRWLSSVSFESDAQLTSLESSTFVGCSLTSIVIPRSVEKIESGCFSECGSMSSVLIESPSELKRLESAAFSGS
jgi:hypothetical protein